MTQKKTEPKGRDFYYNPSTNEMELVSDPSPLRPTPNKKPIHQQLLDLKHWAQPETKKELNTGGYVDQEQRIYENIPLPGYETYEKSDASYKKLKEKEKMADARHKGPSYDHSARSLDDEIKLGKQVWLAKQKEEKKLIKFALEESPVPIVKNPVLKKAINDQQLKKDAYDEKKYGIKQRLKNVRGPHVADLIYKGMTPHEKGSHNAEQRRKKLDNPFTPKNIEPVKVFDTTPVEPELPVAKEKDIREIVQGLAYDRHKAELKAYDQEHGRGGITEIIREKI